MIPITSFEPTLAASLPETSRLLLSSHLAVSAGVSRITLHGSRGLAGGYRPTSDIDLSLIVHPLPALSQENLESFLLDVLETTRRHWSSVVELDLAVIYETRACGLACFEQTAWNDQFCALGVDCFGLYKVGKGFHGFVTNAGIQVQRMYPCLKIWQRT